MTLAITTYLIIGAVCGVFTSGWYYAEAMRENPWFAKDPGYLREQTIQSLVCFLFSLVLWWGVTPIIYLNTRQASWGWMLPGTKLEQ